MAQPAQEQGSAFKAGHIEVDGFPIRYLEAGQGNSVVFLDGFTWGLSKLRDALAAQYRVVAIELPGPNRSPGNSNSQSAEDLAIIAAQAAGELIPERYTLIGVSNGANVALWQALQTPERVEALILISPTIILPEDIPAAGTPEETDALLFARPENSNNWASADPSFAAKKLELVEQLRISAHDASVERRLAEIRCPTLVVFGASDKIVSSGAARIYSEHIPNSHVSFVYEAGHLIEAERPQPLINVVSDFVERRETFVVARESSIINP